MATKQGKVDKLVAWHPHFHSLDLSFELRQLTEIINEHSPVVGIAVFTPERKSALLGLLCDSTGVANQAIADLIEFNRGEYS